MSQALGAEALAAGGLVAAAATAAVEVPADQTVFRSQQFPNRQHGSP
ncbi:hypothetical protein [Allopontixanthobacter sediminis]|uniref:Uncharacterized protein n=1 Tax=Allopontixanthobacter sediminis TaxID=1689985 RepID=A0A845B2Q4_9SPHN|nr:hypothetical protein [Allopontixanthobacter sediminis]MXP44608.1 hypothetical protein [Allopontixanthobacter sediminis]